MSSVNVIKAAQWLSDQSLAITLALAALALLAELMSRQRIAQATLTVTAGAWRASWRTNALLFAAGLALSWALSPWLSPWVSQLLSGREGVLSLFDWPIAVRLVAGLVLLDVVSYGVHWCEHRFAFWWRLHQVHHSDSAMTASTHFRHHPLSVLVDMLARLPLLWLLGIPAVSWVIYALLSTLVQLWHHAQIATPMWLERALSPIIVTPRFHRLHHHPDRAVHDHNFGTLFPWWDSLFGTYDARWREDVAQTAVVGLAGVTARHSGSIVQCLMAPFATLTAPTPTTIKSTRRARNRR